MRAVASSSMLWMIRSHPSGRNRSAFPGWMSVTESPTSRDSPDSPPVVAGPLPAGAAGVSSERGRPGRGRAPPAPDTAGYGVPEGRHHLGRVVGDHRDAANGGPALFQHAHRSRAGCGLCKGGQFGSGQELFYPRVHVRGLPVQQPQGLYRVAGADRPATPAPDRAARMSRSEATDAAGEPAKVLHTGPSKSSRTARCLVPGSLEARNQRFSVRGH